MSEELYDQIGTKLAETYGTVKGQMFGKACLKTNSNNKAFVAFFKGEMVFKLGQKEVNLLIEKYIGAVKWDPSGKKRPMKDWIQIPSEYHDDWTNLAKQALDFVENSK
ncbi:MAG: hypothetical protein MI810_11455 [Flavobacteriales bacterium]|nr:hypothetical protein [Flavobacteriales bacterium]